VRDVKSRVLKVRFIYVSDAFLEEENRKIRQRLDENHRRRSKYQIAFTPVNLLSISFLWGPCCDQPSVK
jgi:hypothetical protein